MELQMRVPDADEIGVDLRQASSPRGFVRRQIFVHGIARRRMNKMKSLVAKLHRLRNGQAREVLQMTRREQVPVLQPRGRRQTSQA